MQLPGRKVLFRTHAMPRMTPITDAMKGTMLHNFQVKFLLQYKIHYNNKLTKYTTDKIKE